LATKFSENKYLQGNRISPVDETVRVQIGGEVKPADGKGRAKRTPTQQNRIVSTKYSLITFLPQNLFEQFRRIANFYFLIMTIIAMSIGRSTKALHNSKLAFFLAKFNAGFISGGSLINNTSDLQLHQQIRQCRR
jgi:hypothetical protein